MAWIRLSGVRGKGLVRVALLPLNLLIAFWQSARAIFAMRPDVVLGMGGYVAFPGRHDGVALQRPLVVHEQNSIAGLANRVLAQVADRVLAAFPARSARSREWTGQSGARGDRRLAGAATSASRGRSGPLRLLVVGGSLGAQTLNDMVPQALALMPEAQRPMVTHQAGDNTSDAVATQLCASRRGAPKLLAFIDDMAAATPMPTW